MRRSPSKLKKGYFSAPPRLGKWMTEPSDSFTKNSAAVNSMTIWRGREEAEGDVKDPPKKGDKTHTMLYRSSRFGAHLKLLALLERKASLPHLLTPFAPLVGVADHLVLVPVRVEAGV